MMYHFRKLAQAIGLIDYTDYYTIQKTPTGKWSIYDQDGHSIRTYARRRDAFRGAERSGLTVV